MRVRMAGLVGAAVALGAAGCGNGPFPVRGKVVWQDGRPAGDLEGSRVVFYPPNLQYNSHGIVGPDGSFSMSTQAKDDGVFPGPHQVSIIEHRSGGGEGRTPGTLEPLAPARLDPKYSEPETSGLTVEVGRRNQEVVLTVTAAKGRK